MNSSAMGGASISARTRTPSVNLSRLAEILAKALDPADTPTESILSADQARLNVHLGQALRCLYKAPGFKEDLAAGNDTGFIRDLEIPPRGTTAKVGGRLLPGSEGKTTSAIEKLHDVIAQHLDTALTSVSLPNLTVSSAQLALDTLAQNLDIRLPGAPQTAGVVPIGFAASDRKVVEREKDVARLLSAIELVDGRDWLERMLDGIRNQLTREDLEDEEIRPILQTIRDQKDQPGSQIRRFLDFLDDEALARVRLQVTFRLMQSVATQSGKPGLVAYVERVLKCFELFASSAGKSLPLDASLTYGQRNTTDLAEQLRKALFFGCLPVWAEGSAQLFEARVDPDKGGATKREVSYRFRVNGDNPESGKSAFATRVDRIEERLTDEERRDGNHARAIAELVFLRLVVPNDLEQPALEDLEKVSDAIAAALKKNPEGTVRKLIAQLREREKVVEHLAQSLIKVLQTKSAKLVDDANRVADSFYVVIHKGMVDWSAVRSMSSRNAEILVKNDTGHDNIAWFQHLTITNNPAEVRGLVSYPVETHLVERSISPTGNRTEIRMNRNLDQPILPVHFVPHVATKTADGTGAWVPADSLAAAFDLGCGICFEYDERSLTLSKNAKHDEKANAEQLRASGAAAFALLAYLILWEVARRTRHIGGLEDLAMHLIRLQIKGKETKPEDGTSAIYAACQAVERALSRELLVKMQGFNTQGETRTAEYRKKNSLLALQGSFPIRSSIGGSLDKVAVISYVTRPCDVHPSYPDADGYLFMSKTFCADRDGEVMQLRADRMQSRLVESRKSFREPQLILEEIARLRAVGYEHIVLLSHHFGNRHIGRAAERHSPHSTHEFLESTATKFPDVRLYSLRRDVFPATRLHTRSGSESAFEATSFADHQRMYEQSERDLLRGLQPIYTFATLAVVSEGGRPQSGFCTYFFDIEQRLSDVEWSEAVRQNILGTTPQGKTARESILGVLRGIHFLESERAATKYQVLPVLDPFGWVAPVTTAAAGELQVMERRGRGNVMLSFPALLAHVTKVLHKNKESQ
ncbi:hypothetical protein HFK84_15965 [Ralstonia pseudosolanacearum]|uniref:hypothetical protein n=1 Tax=Ralstonia pseudosolanacearum TaxID=1310165 RepID=UPI002005F16E|nr:hypothetical protein [Ralstonia pseudosolanacearum]MCK4143763.1 hypothetical protein [Ralstonia pseudosolanacearum]